MKHPMSPTIFLAFYLILGSWKGYLALFDQDAQEPKQIFPCSVDTLPQEDQISLDAGIMIRNDRQLQQLLEDYLS